MKAETHPYRFSARTLGCKVNQYESESLVSDFEKKGFIFVPPGKPVDLLIINTCAVTGKAAMQARQAIRQAIRQNPEAVIVVTGCYAQAAPDDIKKIPGVHYIIGQSDKHRLVEILDDDVLQSLSFRQKKTRVIRHDFEEKQPFQTFGTIAMGGRTRPYLKIQDGCNGFCSYCIVPYTRGRNRSLPVNDVLGNIHRIHDAGYYETVLTGMHIGSYGEDLFPKTSLYCLLLNIIHETAIHRIRLSSIEPNELSENIIGLAADSNRFCRHFHVPLQSGDNEILQQMNRPYSREFYKELIHGIHQRVPDCGIGADVMAGFPGETDSAFENTLRLIEELPITYLHVFPFSPRKGTRASLLSDRISPQVIKERCRKLRLLGIRKKKNFYETFMGKTVEVLIEEHQSEHGGMLKGMTSNYVPVLFRGSESMKNQLVNVHIRDLVHENPESAEMALLGSIRHRRVHHKKNSEVRSRNSE